MKPPAYLSTKTMNEIKAAIAWALELDSPDTSS
jgi:hypothetical protein